MSPDERRFLAAVHWTLVRARLIAIAEAALWGLAAAPISRVGGLMVFTAAAILRLGRISRVAVVRSLERATPEARNLFVTADELSRGRLGATEAARTRVFADASSRASSIDVRLAVPARPIWRAAIGAGLVWSIAVIVRSPGGPVQQLVQSRAGPRPSARDPGMTVTVVVHPPSYTGLGDARIVDPAELRAVEGSVAVLTIKAAAPRLTIEHDGAVRTLTPTAGGAFADRVPLTKTGYLVIAPETGDRRTMPIVIVPDARPTVRISAPGRDLVFAGGNPSIGFAARATDDYGLRSMSLRYTKVSGSGENFAFADGEIPLTLSAANARDWSGTAARTLAELALQEGDMLVYRAVAADARPGDGSAQSDAFFIEISRLGIAAGDAFTMPEQETRYALSQQMLIVKTDRLANARGSMTADQFGEASLSLAVEQRMIRAEFVFMLGGEIEDEEVEAERSVELQAGRLANRGQGDLRAATIAMSQAEKLLTAVNLTDALVAERKAVAALQRAFARDRYILRASPTRVDLDPKRRLTGNLSAAAGWSRQIPATPENRRIAQLQDLLEGLGDLAARADRSRAAVLAETALRIDPQAAGMRQAAASLQRAADAWAQSTAAEKRSAIDTAIEAVSAEAKRALFNAPVELRDVAPGLRRALAERAR
ncbi:MAG TPA: hypothetical protein VKH42_08600 [Vicinamibacterales bacterium]|nr:hypothetical protein [Vicinamibacterales bacterium]